MAKPNNITRLLDSRNIHYQAFDLPEFKLGAKEAADALGVSPSVVFKTIVIRPAASKPLWLVLVPGTAVVDLKKVAAVLGEKKVHLPTEREAEQLTGLLAGGISPLALINKGFRVLIDASALELEEMYVSGGQRGLNIRLRVEDLASLTKARFAAVSAHGAG